MKIMRPSGVTAAKVAQFFICLSNESGSYISNLKLQKVLYYAQGWHLGLHGKPLFEDDFQAWVHGPAIPHIYGQYKHYGYQPITNTVEPDLDPDVKAFLKDVADVFLPFDAYELELATHREPPWINARNGLPLDTPCKNTISKADMQEFFAQQAKENGAEQN